MQQTVFVQPDLMDEYINSYQCKRLLLYACAQAFMFPQTALHTHHISGVFMQLRVLHETGTA